MIDLSDTVAFPVVGTEYYDTPRRLLGGKLVCQHDRDGYCHACTVAKGRADAAYRRVVGGESG